MTPATNAARDEAARALGAIVGGQSIDWEHVLHRRSFLELDALARAEALVDDGTIRVLSGPFERLESPWLQPQDVTPQSDDGVVIARGTIGGTAVVIASIEQEFQGGGIGEVSGAKITQALRLAAASSRQGIPVPAVLLLETGGVRLQEANLGLNAVAEICSALLELRPLAPVIGVVAGSVGSFGGVSIATGLCTHVIITPEGRIGLNGAAVIEQEAGAEEFDSSDRSLIWAVVGGEQRRLTGLADTLVVDDAAELRDAVREAVAAGPASPGSHRSERLDVLDARLATLDPANPPEPRQLREMWGDTYGTPPAKPAAPPASRAPSPAPVSPTPALRCSRADAAALGSPRWLPVPHPGRSSARCCARTPTAPPTWPSSPTRTTRSTAPGKGRSASPSAPRLPGSFARSPSTTPTVPSAAPSSLSSTCPARLTAASRRWPDCTRRSPRRSMPPKPPESPGTQSSRSSSGKHYRADSWRTDCRHRRSWPSMTQAW